MKRKVRVWGKINLFETSVVGIAAYPDAHLSVNEFSLCKALSSTEPEGEQLNTKEGAEMSEETTETEPVAEATTEVTEEAPVEEKSETEAKTETEEVSEKSISAKDVESIVKSALKEALKEMQPTRGLVEKDKATEAELIKNADTGALALTLFRQAYPQQ